MRPIFNFYDPDEPFASKQQPDPTGRPSMLPNPKKRTTPTTSRQRQPLATINAPSTVRQTTRNQATSNSNRVVKPEKNIIKKPPMEQSCNSSTSSSQAQDQQQQEKTLTRQPLFTDSMVSQVTKETSIIAAEKKLNALLEEFHSSKANLEKFTLPGHSNADLKLLLELTDKLAVERKAAAIGREQLQKARAAFVRELTDYEEALVSHVDELGPLIGRFNGLVAKWAAKSEDDENGVPAKPEMVDKQVQAIPELSTLSRSPSAPHCHIYSRQIVELPASPVLRTSIKKPPMASSGTTAFSTPVKFNLNL